MWLFMLPSLAVMTVVLVYPLASAIYYSFLRYYLGGGTPQFIGLANYVELLGDERFWGDLLNTVIIVGASVALQLVMGMALALALYAATRGVRLISLLNFLPNVVTPVVGAIFLKWLFIGRFGLLDSTLISFDIYPPNWLGDPVWAKITLILADTWKFMPFLMLVLYAGLQAFDTQLLEAAQIDGANAWQRLRYVILPMMKPLILFVVAIRAMDAFRFFDLVYVLTNGGPGTATETVTLYTYQIGFRMLEVGKASALGVITLVIVAAMIAGLIFMMSRRGREAF
ncbi:MAG TPA: sugar ABC transporter permease [Acetobacteraceae bacterium]|jgi:multiple sugar transport system permease protein|nr:sugar ABC transporter permease [Acetobacteraceae bacterium]